METLYQIKKERPKLKQATDARIHGIDALRGIAMLLGIVLHATIAYRVVPFPTWPKDPQHSLWAYDFLYFVIHSFRMPMFFLIAGYFCRFLYYKTGEKNFIRHRWKRIGIPFLISLVLIVPFTIYPFLLNDALQVYNTREAFSISLRQLLGWNGMAHLWFLYYLLLFYGAVLVFQRLRKIPVIGNLITKGATLWGRYDFTNAGWLFLAAIPVWLIMLPSSHLYVMVDTGFIPAFYYPLFYAYFFLLGWLVHLKSDILGILSRNTWWMLVPGIVLTVVLFFLEFKVLPGQTNESIHNSAKALAAFQIILVVFGTTGFFLKTFHAENKTWKYLSDASYWMYLLHLGIVAGLQVTLAYSGIPGWIRFPLILIITGFITLYTYEKFVRYSIVGEYLHGRREKNKKSTTVSNL